MATKYRADHIGSLLRPQDLQQFRTRRSMDREQLRALEDKHILGVLQRQKELGFKIFTDGELRRHNFMSDFNEAVEGLEDRKSTRLNSSHLGISYAVFCLKKKKKKEE